ncbi:MAG TPA: LysM peptidoglycan-binding domain-containing protein [Patescibacteria group bacterium]|nr:LysM peptidoglycan-binding domain-containing protein [Patescibacteria group bacterium]
MPEKVKVDGSLVSLALGALVLLIVGLSVFNYFSRVNRPEVTPEAEQTKQEERAPAEGTQPEETPQERFTYREVSLPTTYSVQKGDHLWGIAIRFYDSGYNWVDIAQANKLVNPNLIHSGNTLEIPAVEVRKPEAKGVTPAATTEAQITGAEYVVQRGDNLWKIAEQAYGSGYEWTKIAQTNHLASPGIIHQGNVLILPR